MVSTHFSQCMYGQSHQIDPGKSDDGFNQSRVERRMQFLLEKIKIQNANTFDLINMIIMTFSLCGRKAAHVVHVAAHTC